MPQPEQLFLWHCPDLRCATSRKIPLHVTEGRIGRIHMATSADGKVFILQDEVVLTLKL